MPSSESKLLASRYPLISLATASQQHDLGGHLTGHFAVAYERCTLEGELHFDRPRLPCLTLGQSVMSYLHHSSGRLWDNLEPPSLRSELQQIPPKLLLDSICSDRTQYYHQPNIFVVWHSTQFSFE